MSKERVERRPRGRIDRDERARDERDREEHSDHRGYRPPATAKYIDHRVANQGHSRLPQPTTVNEPRDISTLGALGLSAYSRRGEAGRRPFRTRFPRPGISSRHDATR